MATVVIIVGQTGSMSGYSYVDSNDDGVKESNEVGIPDVTVTLSKTDGPVTFTLTQTTQANGLYDFTTLPPGVYTITETQPAFFAHGKDTASTPAPASISAGQFAGMTLSSGDNATDYDFGELGLKAAFVSAYLNRRAFFSSSDPNTSDLNLNAGDVWISYDAGLVGQLSAAASSSGPGTIGLTLYDENMVPVSIATAGTSSSQLNFTATSGQPYFLKISGTSSSVDLQTSLSDLWHNSKNPYDVAGLGTVTPIDALDIINLLNLYGSGSLANMNVPSGMMPDVQGTGDLTPLDAVLVINQLNFLTTHPVANALASGYQADAGSSAASAANAATASTAAIAPMTSVIAATNANTASTVESAAGSDTASSPSVAAANSAVSVTTGAAAVAAPASVVSTDSADGAVASDNSENAALVAAAQTPASTSTSATLSGTAPVSSSATSLSAASPARSLFFASGTATPVSTPANSSGKGSSATLLSVDPAAVAAVLAADDETEYRWF